MHPEEKIASRYQLSADAITSLALHAEIIELGKKQIAIAEGQRDDHVYFIIDGSIRAYAMREERCVILFFAFEGDAASLPLGQKQSPTASYTIETMEPSVLLRIPRQRMEELLGLSTELANWGRRITEEILRGHEEYFLDYSWREKGAQYERLLRKYPELFQRVPLKDLASYLMVTPQTLSRIRASIK